MKPIKLGITGGIGSGKSVICRVLHELGIPVYNADSEAKTILESDKEVQHAVKKLLGDAAYNADGSANRPFIAAVVFNDPEKLLALNNIIHPAVRKHFMAWVDQNSKHKIVVKEAAVMFESGSWKDMDVIAAVIAPEPLRIHRVLQRDPKTESQVRSIIEKQLPETELIKRSDFVIHNNDHQLVVPQVLELLKFTELKMEQIN